MIIFLPVSLVSTKFVSALLLIYGTLFLLFSSFIKLPVISDRWISISIILFIYKCLFSWVETAYLTTLSISLFMVFGLLSFSFLLVALKQTRNSNQTYQQS
jgi:multisubunit Na+/H+ antiporter MnhF subunit